MNHSRWFNRLSWALALTSCFVMTTSPLAMAKEAQNKKADMLKAVLQQSGLNSGSSITYMEFWNKVKDNFSPELQAKLLPAVIAQKDEKIPKIEVSEVKSAKGEMVPRITMNMDGQVFSFEYPADGKSVAKVNGTVISANTLADLEKSGNQVQLNQANTKKAAVYKKNMLAKSITPSFAQWSKMTAWQRAYYLSRVRLVMDSTLDVLSFKKAKKTSSFEYNKYEYFFAALFGTEAFAGKGQLTDTSYAVGSACISHGYSKGRIALSSGNPYCTLNDGDGKLSPDYTKNCSAGQVRCNPVMYGYERSGGSTLCAPYSLSSSQSATASHRGGVCETGSPLSGKPEETLEFVKSIMAKENNVNPTDLEKLIFMKDGKATVTKESFDSYLKPMLDRFNAEKDQAEVVCTEIDKNPNAYQREGSVAQTEACSALRARIASVRLALESIVTDGGGQAASCDPSKPDFIQGGFVQPGGNCACNLPQAYELTGRDGKKYCSESNVADCKSTPIVKEDGTSDCQDDQRREDPVKPEKKKKGSFWGSFFGVLLIGTVAGLGINCLFKLGILGLCKGKKHPRPTYVPPVVDPGGTVDPTDPTPVEPQPISETPSGATSSPVDSSTGGVGTSGTGGSAR